MASGTIKSSTGTTLNLILDWTSTKNTTANSSTVVAKLYIESYALYASDLGENFINIDGTRKMFDCTQSYSGGLAKRLIATYTKTVSHDANGEKKDMYISGQWKFKGTYAGVYMEGIFIQGYVDLDTIDVSVDTPTTCTSSGWYGVGRTVTIAWNAVTNATRYEIEYRNEVLGVWGAWKDRRSTTSTSYPLTISVAEDAIQFRVRAVRNTVYSDWKTSTVRYHTFITVATATGYDDWGYCKAWTGTEWKDCRARRWTGTEWGRVK